MITEVCMRIISEVIILGIAIYILFKFKTIKTLWKEINKTKFILGLIIIAIIMPFLIVVVRLLYDGTKIITEQPYDSNWLSFLGSYLGGLLGGIATLIAVVRTIDSNKEEQDRKEETEKEKEIQKSAVIIYYDFSFAFENIVKFLEEYEDMLRKTNIKFKKRTDIIHYSEYEKCKIWLDQFYFDPYWIHTVANLRDLSLFDADKIDKIYETYGHLSNINKSLNTSDQMVCKNAYRSMKCLIDSDTGRIENEFASLLNVLKYVAFQRFLSDPNKVKIILSDLSDQLIGLLRKINEENKSISESEKEDIINIFDKIDEKHELDFPENERIKMTDEVQTKLSCIKTTDLSKEAKFKIIILSQIIPILRKHSYPLVRTEVYEQIEKDYSSENDRIDQKIILS